jgi:hypothetical protein
MANFGCYEPHNPVFGWAAAASFQGDVQHLRLGKVSFFFSFDAFTGLLAACRV